MSDPIALGEETPASLPTFSTTDGPRTDVRAAPGHPNIVTSAHFGVNLLFDRDDNHDDTTGGSVGANYARAVDSLKAGSFRFPGGTVSEVLFDLRDPDNTVQDGSWQDANYPTFDPDFAGPMGLSNLTLTGALDYARDTGMSMIFVMPTLRFLSGHASSDGHRYSDVDEAQVTEFVTNLLDDARSRGVHIEALEIGNEWYGDYTGSLGTRLTPVEYGRIASALSAVIQAAIDAWKAQNNVPSGWQEPDIAIQVGHGGDGETYRADGHIMEDGYTGPTKSATQLIFEQFGTAAERAAIDGLIRHRYLGGSVDLADGWGYQPFDVFDSLAEAAGGFGELDRYVTEWNVFNGNVDLIDHLHASAMVSMFAEFMDAGIDHAYVWAVQQNNFSRLSRNIGLAGEDYGGLSPGGEMFRLMATSLPGLAHVQHEHALPTVRTEVFRNEDRAVVYISNIATLEDGAVRMTLDAGAILPGFTHVWATSVFGPPHVTADPVRVQVYAIEDLLKDGLIYFKLLAGEVVQLSLSFGQALDIQGHELHDSITGTVFDDTLRGEGGADRIRGGDGADLVVGGAGFDRMAGDDGADRLLGGAGLDRIDGNAGDDVILGGFGADELQGNAGADDLSGGSGNDSVHGGAGDDLLDGGSGADTLNGGAGDDALAGGTGADRFVFEAAFGKDTIRDFAVAQAGELIDLRSVATIRNFRDLWTNHLSQTAEGDAMITAGLHSITLAGVTVDSLSAGDFLF